MWYVGVYFIVNFNGWPWVWFVLNRSWFMNTRLSRILYIIVTLAYFFVVWALAIINLETDQYLKKSFITNLAALLWTISSLKILCLVDGNHTGEAHSRIDLIIVIYYNTFPWLKLDINLYFVLGNLWKSWLCLRCWFQERRWSLDEWHEEHIE